MSSAPDPAPPIEPLAPIEPMEPALPAAPQPLRRRLWSRLWLRPRELAILLRGLVVLALTGASLASFAMQRTGSFRVADFVNSNQIGSRGRLQMVGWLALGAATGLLAGLWLYFAGRRPITAQAARVLRTARLLSPLLLPGLAAPLIAAREWEALPRIGAVAVLALLAEICVTAAAGELLAGRLGAARWLARVGRRTGDHLRRIPRAVAPERLVLVLGVLFYAVWMSAQTILQHRQFGSMAFDLGTYDNMFFNALNGHPFRCTGVLREGKDWSMLSNHAEFTLFALLPFYALRPGPETLLVLQAVALASGAIPLYRFAARRLSPGAALLLALAYLVYAPMHQANFYDIHFQPFAAAFTLWALDALDGRRPILFGLFFLLALGCREDVPIGFAVVGVFLLLTGHRAYSAIIMTTVAVVYFVVVKFAVMPRFGSWWFSDLYKDLYPPNDSSYGGVVKTLLTNPVYVWKTLVIPEKIVFFLLVITPVAFLPLRRGLLPMSLLPAAMFTLLTTGYSPTIEISFQYVCLYIPFIFLATALALAAYGASKPGRAKRWGALGALALASFLTTRVWGAMPAGDKFRGGFREISAFRPTTEAERQKARDLKELVGRIPFEAPVAVSEHEYPHVSTRLNCYALRMGYEGADFILYAEDSGGHGADNAKLALDSGEFEVMERREGSKTALLRRKPSPPAPKEDP